MDLGNLEKWKVAELRQELQSRGLDTKGIKAILIERLRKHLNEGGVPLGTGVCISGSGGGGSSSSSNSSPSTTSRRTRRSQSTTRSPSPNKKPPLIGGGGGLGGVGTSMLLSSPLNILQLPSPQKMEEAVPVDYSITPAQHQQHQQQSPQRIFLPREHFNVAVTTVEQQEEPLSLIKKVESIYSARSEQEVKQEHQQRALELLKQHQILHEQKQQQQLQRQREEKNLQTWQSDLPSTELLSAVPPMSSQSIQNKESMDSTLSTSSYSFHQQQQHDQNAGKEMNLSSSAAAVISVPHRSPIATSPEQEDEMTVAQHTVQEGIQGTSSDILVSRMTDEDNDIKDDSDDEVAIVEENLEEKQPYEQHQKIEQEDEEMPLAMEAEDNRAIETEKVQIAEVVEMNEVNANQEDITAATFQDKEEEKAEIAPRIEEQRTDIVPEIEEEMSEEKIAHQPQIEEKSEDLTEKSAVEDEVQLCEEPSKELIASGDENLASNQEQITTTATSSAEDHLVIEENSKMNEPIVIHMTSLRKEEDIVVEDLASSQSSEKSKEVSDISISSSEEGDTKLSLDIQLEMEKKATEQENRDSLSLSPNVVEEKAPDTVRSRSGSKSIKDLSLDDGLRPAKIPREDQTIPEDEPVVEDKQFGLSWFDSDLHLRIDPITFTYARPDNQDIYLLLWSGVRSNYGVREGKVCYEVYISDEINFGANHEFVDEPFVHGFRVGFSLAKTSLLLGEGGEYSFAYCESGRKATGGQFLDYAESFSVGDVVGCYLDLKSTPCTIQYTLNGRQLGVAFEFDKSFLDADKDQALFPHILTKGYGYQVNFADNDNLLLQKVGMRKKKTTKKDNRLHSSNAESKKNSPEQVEKETEKTEKECDNSESSKIQEESTHSDKVDLSEVDDYPNEKSADPASSEQEKDSGSDTKVEHSDNVTGEKTPATTTIEEKPPEKEGKEAVEADGESNTNDSEPPQAAKRLKLSIEEKSEGEKEVLVEKMDEEISQKEKDMLVGKMNEEISQEEKEVQVENMNEEISQDEKEMSVAKLDEVSQEEKEQQKEKVEVKQDDDEQEGDQETKTSSALSLLNDYELIALIPEEKYVSGPQKPSSRKDCEVILMVGLPGSGKTTWALNHIKENPHKHYYVIGADSLVSKMAVDGVPREKLHKGDYNRVFEKCYNILGSLENIAMKRRRNFIIDQNNLYASAQRRKMKGFNGYKRIAVICLPNEEELKQRLAAQKEKEFVYAVKEWTMNHIQANFSMPSLDLSWFDEILYTDLKDDEAKEEVKRINEKGKKAIDASFANRDKHRQRFRDDYRPQTEYRRTFDDRRRYVHRPEVRWYERHGNMAMNSYPSTGGGMAVGNRWGMGGGNGYRNVMRGTMPATGGDRQRNYDHRQNSVRFGYNGGPATQSTQNWAYNNRNHHRSYDDRHNRYNSSGNGNIGRYDGYNSSSSAIGGGGGGMASAHRSYRSNNEYRDSQRNSHHHHHHNRSMSSGGGGGGGGGNGGGGSHSNTSRSYRSGNGSFNNGQRDFYGGHRDIRTDSRGGLPLTTKEDEYVSQHNRHHFAAADEANAIEAAAANAASLQYNKNQSQHETPANNSSWKSYNHHQHSSATPTSMSQHHHHRHHQQEHTHHQSHHHYAYQHHHGTSIASTASDLYSNPAASSWQQYPDDHLAEEDLHQYQEELHYHPHSAYHHPEQHHQYWDYSLQDTYGSSEGQWLGMEAVDQHQPLEDDPWAAWAAQSRDVSAAHHDVSEHHGALGNGGSSYWAQHPQYDMYGMELIGNGSAAIVTQKY